MTNNVSEKVNKNLCTGCGACVQSCNKNALSLVQDKKGFLYPEVNNTLCTECGLCLQKCHILRQDVLNYEEQQAYGFKHNDDVRKKGSSGGAFILLSDYVLKHGGVVYGAAYSDDNIADVRHIRAVTPEQRDAVCGSKYVQSNVCDVLPQVKDDLINGKKVLFTGTPCQVAGLKKYLNNQNYDNLILCDIFCHSVPSPLLFRDHINLLERNKNKKIINYTSREKRFGWTRCDCIYYEDGSQEYSSMRSQLYYLLFITKLACRPSCTNCLYAGCNRTGDFTIGDYWGADKSVKDNLGVSSLLVNTDKGRKMFNEMDIPGWIQEQKISRIFVRNHSEPITPNPNNENFWADYTAHGYEFVMKKYLNYNLYGKCVFWLKKKLRKAKTFIKNTEV